MLEAAKLPHPIFVNGIQQKPIEGVSMTYTFDAPEAPERHDVQYFEVFVNRGIYHKGWTACTRHSTPWLASEELGPYDDDVWELYAPDDHSQAHDLAAEMPDKLKELQRLFLIEATKYDVLPLDDRRLERFDPVRSGRPALITGDSQMVYKGMSRLPEHAVLNVKNKSHAVTAEIEVPPGGASGAIVAQGGSTGGWALYALRGRLAYVFNFCGIEHYRVLSDTVLPEGTCQVRMEFGYDGGGLGKGGDVALFVDGKEVGKGRVEATMPLLYSLDETLDLGTDDATQVSPDYDRDTCTFNGSVNWARIDIADAAANSDHYITAEDRLRVAMGRQ